MPWRSGAKRGGGHRWYNLLGSQSLEEGGQLQLARLSKQNTHPFRIAWKGAVRTGAHRLETTSPAPITTPASVRALDLTEAEAQSCCFNSPSAVC